MPSPISDFSSLHLEAAGARDLHEFLQKQKIPKYKKLPEVEVSFQVRSISDLDSKTGTFLADFLLELHWVDPGLERDTHYTEDLREIDSKPCGTDSKSTFGTTSCHCDCQPSNCQDYQSQTLQLFPAFESHIFNPEVVLENAVEALAPLPSSDSKPEIQAEAVLQGLWMRRRVHYKGLFACANISYANFPLDTHAISISVSMKKWRGITPKAISPVPEVKQVRSRSKDPKQEAWPGHAEAIHLGDLNFVAWGVWSHHGPESSEGRDVPHSEILLTFLAQLKSQLACVAELNGGEASEDIAALVGAAEMQFGVKNGMDIKPWTYYPPESLEACQMLCTTPGLDETTVELMVEEWREMLYDENVEIISQDQEKNELLESA
eukprot:g24711.t1